jgi:hypothetical protein
VTYFWQNPTFGRASRRPNQERRPRIRTTFSTITPESAEQGDFAETGFIDEEGAEIEPDEDETLAQAAARWLESEGASEASSTQFHRGVWYSTEYDTDYRTGEEEQRSFHLKDFTPEEEREVWDWFHAGRRR